MQELIEQISNASLRSELSCILFGLCKQIVDFRSEITKEKLERNNEKLNEWINNDYNKIVDKEKHKKVAELAGCMLEEFKVIANKYRDTSDVEDILDALCTSFGCIIGVFANNLADESSSEIFYESKIRIISASFNVYLKFAQE